MMKTTTLLILGLLLSGTGILAQDDERKATVDVSADLVSRYVWRGMILSSSPAVQPSLSLTLNKVSIGSWASYSLNPELYQEVDLFVTYETEYIAFTVNDYYNPGEFQSFTGDYFHLAKDSTRHTLEGMITLNGPESFPLSLMAGVMFYGNDRDENGKNLYSTYLELSYTSNVHDTEVMPFIGITPCKGYYGEKFGVVNLGISAAKQIQLTDKIQIPLKGSFVLNPQRENVYFVIGITL
jgi:hypothetical protein